MITEKAFQQLVIDAAHALGWRSYHTHDSRRSAAGFPDLVLVRERVIFAELKTDKGRVSAAQDEWLHALEDAGAEVYVWKPGDWRAIEETLRETRTSVPLRGIIPARRRVGAAQTARPVGNPEPDRSSHD